MLKKQIKGKGGHTLTVNLHLWQLSQEWSMVDCLSEGIL